MRIDQEIQKKITSGWFKFLQNKIYEEFQKIEVDFAKKKKLKPVYFKKNEWKKQNTNEGGGI